jgi:hypothetical protein
MRTPPYLTDAERAERVAYGLALEIARIVDDLELRQVFLVEMWGRHRDRGPFLDTLHTRYATLGFPELALLPPDALAKVDEFYRELEEFRLYVRFTEDMPTSLADAYRWQLNRLSAYAEQAVDALGGTPERPLLDIPDPVDTEPAEVRPLLKLAHYEKPPEEDP